MSNFKPGVDDDQLAKLAMEAGDVHSIWRERPTTLQVRYVHVRDAQQFDKESGEIESVFRVTIVTDDGEVWATNSPVASRVFLALLEHSRLRHKFDPPLTVQFRYVGTLAGGTVIQPSVNTDELRRMLQS